MLTRFRQKDGRVFLFPKKMETPSVEVKLTLVSVEFPFEIVIYVASRCISGFACSIGLYLRNSFVKTDLHFEYHTKTYIFSNIATELKHYIYVCCEQSSSNYVNHGLFLVILASFWTGKVVTLSTVERDFYFSQ